ncbi:hypothetical protein E2C01_084239 [Portunus trituberculatus]|uniref:Uncharacterized protein n=1 Tax=Portunus trituberculatus TaxID=210409 RepID=A0A5B7J3R5_PORTR|nr:hypothetical protein [Portunus trituberculatus]
MQPLNIGVRRRKRRESVTNTVFVVLQEVDGYCEQLQQGAQGRLGELTQLCGLAFSTEEGEAALNPPSDPLDLTTYPNPLTAHSPVQGESLALLF